jgi:DNA topoisomerase-2
MDLKADKAIKNYKAYSDRGKNKPHFVIEESKDGIKCSLETLKLKSYLQMGNMVLFTKDGNIKKYSSVSEIIDEFCKIRYEYYELRKAYILKSLRLNKLILENKIRFLFEVINDELIIHKREEEEVIKEMETKKYYKKDGNYNYLLNMQIRSFTNTKIVELENELKIIKEKINYTEEKSEKEMWLEELDNFEKAYLNKK